MLSSIIFLCSLYLSNAQPPQPTVLPGVFNTGDTLTQLLGPVPLTRYTGSGVTAQSASDLNCNFFTPCCWSNVGPPKDNLEWVGANGVPDAQKFQNLFGTNQVPESPYLITTSATGSSTAYGILNSCALQCQSDTGTLTFKQWRSPRTNLDVCVLPIGSNDFTYCQTVTGPGPEASISIPPQSGPFQIVIAASNFVTAPGGADIIDDLSYQATIPPDCSGISTPSPAIPPAPGPGGVGDTGPDVTAICQAIACNFASGLCGYTGTGGTCPFTQRTGAVGCWAGGVPAGPGGPYTGVELGPTAKAILQSPQFTTKKDTVIKFKYYDGPMGVTIKGCVDGEANCPFTSTGTGADRSWKDGTLAVPAGTHSIYFTAANNGGELAGVGIANIGVAKYDGSPATCP